MIRAITVTAMFVFLLISAAPPGDPPYGGVKLLEGYKYKRGRSVDTINGLIYKDGGLSIEFESGVSEGYAVEPKERKSYLWYREQEVNGHKVLLALTQPAVGTKWEPEKPRSRGPRHILMVTFPGTLGPMDAANFHAEVLNDTELADALLMILTFDPTR